MSVVAVTGLLLAMIGSASADTFTNDVVATGNGTIAVGGSTTISFKINATGGDGQTGCNASAGSPATLTINVPAGVTASPSSLIFSACGIPGQQGVEFSSSTPADYVISTSVADAGVGTYINRTGFTLQVTGLPPLEDTTPPEIGYTLDPATPNGANGWWTSVSIMWTVTDVESASVIDSGCVDGPLGDGADQVLSCAATSDGGSSSLDTVPIHVDGTKPATTVTGVGAGATYSTGSVPAAGCSSSDATSGVESEATVAVTGGNVNGVGTLTATCSGANDLAGNVADDASVTYTVVYGGLSGVLQPINPDGSSLFSRGRSVPVKFRLAGDEPNGFSLAGWQMQRVSAACAVNGADLTTESVASTSTSGWRYDTSADQYVFNADFRDKPVGSCWKVRVTLDTGQTMTSTVFKLQK